MKKQIKLRTI